MRSRKNESYSFEFKLHVKQNPSEKENKTLERFFDLLDVMDMEW